MYVLSPTISHGKVFKAEQVASYNLLFGYEMGKIERVTFGESMSIKQRLFELERLDFPLGIEVYT